MKPGLTIVAPTPPPYAGPEVATLHLLESAVSCEFDLHHVKSNIKEENAEKGAFSWLATLRQLRIYLRIIRSRLSGSRALYTLLAVNVLGFLKDAGTIWLGQLLGMRVCAHMKGDTLPAFYRKSRPVMRWLIKRTVRSLDMLLVQAEPIREEIMSTFELDEARVPIIPNMMDEVGECSGGEARTDLLFLGHLSVGKGFVDLIAVFERIAASHQGLQLHCAGEPKTPERDYVAQLTDVPFPEGAEETIREVIAGRRPQVDYRGVVAEEEKNDLFCRSGIFVLPSYSESFPMGILEAMSHGCAVVATRVGAVPEMITDGEEGLLVDPGDREGLEHAIRTLLDDEDQRYRLGANAKDKVEKHYTVEKVVPLFSSAFHQLLG